ncbi:MAG: hypothetical protein H6732_14905 [Alphaproteobacteria bacterium]|nr:hypothetical protein [Alphaproteobacteria bacterium]
MRSWLVGPLVLGVGCLTPAYLPDTDGTQDTDATTDTDPVSGDTDGGDSGEDSGDSGPVVDTFNPGGDSGVDPGNLDPLGCHPFDPTDLSYGAWSRTYQVKFNNGAVTGKEVHLPKGVVGLPVAALETFATNNNMPTEATAYEMKVTDAPGFNQTNTWWRTCEGQGSGKGVEFGFVQQNPQVTLNGWGKTKMQYLPLESEILSSRQPSWNVDSTYKVKYPGGVGCGLKTANRSIKAQYAASGFERITTQATGPIDAWHVTAFLEQTQVDEGSFNPLCLFASVFLEAFGVGTIDPNTGAFKKQKIDRWYVRGLGLVKEKVIDADDANSTFSEKTLTKCSGLPGCP